MSGANRCLSSPNITCLRRPTRIYLLRSLHTTAAWKDKVQGSKAQYSMQTRMIGIQNELELILILAEGTAVAAEGSKRIPGSSHVHLAHPLSTFANRNSP